MAVVEFSLQELEKLVGKTLTKNDIENIIPMIGCPLEKREGDKLFYEIFPNRPDLLSIEGFARTMRHFLGLSKEKKEYKTKPSKISSYLPSILPPANKLFQKQGRIVELLKFRKVLECT